jgi:hypothetical protein
MPDILCDTIDIDLDDLDKVVGGAGIDPTIWSQVKEKAGKYCPATVKQYGGMDPSTITQPVARQMADACVAEMPWRDKLPGRLQLNDGIAKAFPQE